MVMLTCLVVLLTDQNGVSSAPAEPESDANLQGDERYSQLEAKLKSLMKTMTYFKAKQGDLNTRVLSVETNQKKIREENSKEREAFLERLDKLKTSVQSDMDSEIRALVERQDKLESALTATNESLEDFTKGIGEDMVVFASMDSRIRTLEEGQNNLTTALAATNDSLEAFEKGTRQDMMVFMSTLEEGQEKLESALTATNYSFETALSSANENLEIALTASNMNLETALATFNETLESALTVSDIKLEAALTMFNETSEVLGMVEPMFARVESLENKVANDTQLIAKCVPCTATSISTWLMAEIMSTVESLLEESSGSQGESNGTKAGSSGEQAVSSGEQAVSSGEQEESSEEQEESSEEQDVTSGGEEEPSPVRGTLVGREVYNCNDTNGQYQPLWMVDLAGNYTVSRVSILNRKECCEGLKAWRDDGRCGYGTLAENGRPAECYPHGVYPCCSDSGWCGYTLNHCYCSGCVDYRNTVSVPTEECEVEYNERQECGWFGVTHAECAEQGCCFDTLAYFYGGPSCFYVKGWLTQDPSWVVDSSGTPWNGGTHDVTDAFDGNIGTYWDPQGTEQHHNNWYIILDLRASETLTRIAVNNYGDTTHDIESFTLQKSAVGSPYSWEDVASVDAVEAGTMERQEFGGFQGTARYWRFLVTRTHSGWQPSLTELNLYKIPSIKREENLIVRVGPSEISDQNEQCGETYVDTPLDGQTFVVYCNPPMSGRYVSVQQLVERSDVVKLCEVEVYGTG
ncbi:uncharacterized protein LOC118413401 [Branchiostoma floridae]|uniref:Uncharacterized protein LOC118413401 n=1 Tax=Branchiostoma floridae TaxID=7739 RepID=A0A9J7KYI2_BRAFL|nr:uncharacterized protein LOC118413401 [Branchiostoma floridae]